MRQLRRTMTLWFTSRKALDERAAADRTTASDVVREALRRYLKV